jgi:hypothetical protein
MMERSMSRTLAAAMGHAGGVAVVAMGRAAGMASAAGYRLAGRAVSPRQVALIGLVLALAGLIPPRAWRVGRIAVTAVHESGHAAVAILSGRRVTAVHLRADSSGVTYHRGPRRWLGGVVTAGAGYPAPALVGLAGAWLTADRRARAWLIALAVLGIVNVLLWVRNLFGLALMAVWVAAIGWLGLYASLSVGVLVGAAVAWYLVLGGVRAAYELFEDPGPSDAADLGRLVHVPPALFKTLFVLVSVAAAAMSVRLLLFP